MIAKKKLALAVAAALNAGGLIHVASATDIYYETWSGGTIDPTNYTIVNTGTGTGSGASVIGGVLTTDNGNPGSTGNIRVHTPTHGTGTLYDASFNPQLDLNGDGNILTWNINLQESRSNPSGFANTNSGVAYVLGATSSDFLGAGEGYAVTIGSTGTDPVCLVHYTAGMAAIGLNAKSSPFNMILGTTDASTKYESVKVTYAPGTDTWKMYVRDDGTSGFTDPNATPIPDANLVGSKVLAATASSLDFSGYLQTHTSTANNLGRFDNVKLALDPLPVLLPRNLTWDSDGTGSATDGSGAWATVNTWIDQADSSHTTWDGSRPDNATIGAGSGAGSASIDLGTGQLVGLVTFASASPTYTLNNGTLTVSGYDTGGGNVKGMVAHQSAVINSVVNWGGNSKLEVDSGATVTFNGALQGSGTINKNLDGKIILNAPAPSRSGNLMLEAGGGTVVIPTSSVSGGVGGWGTGNIYVHSGATLHLDASAGAYTLTSPAGIIWMGDGGTLKVSGNVTYQRNYPEFFRGTVDSPVGSTIHVDAGGMLLYRAQIRNDGMTTENFHTIHLDGPGTVKLTNAGSNLGGDSNLFSGSWDLSNGMLILGQNTETGGSSGDTLNTLGFKNGDTSMGNQVTVRGTGTLVATENAPNAGVLTYYRAGVHLSGGTLASGNGKDTEWGGHFETVAATTSTLATYDPLNPTIARNVSLVVGAAGISNAQGNTTWNGNLVIDPGTTTGGKFIINRDGGTVTVGTGATITVNQGSTLELNGTLDALNDTTNNRQVNIVNNSTTTLHVISGSKTVGNITGTGNTVVDGGATLTATSMTQNDLNVADNGRTNIPARLGHTPLNRPAYLNSLNLNSSGTLDLNDNDIVVQYGTNPSAFNQVRNYVFQGYSGSPDPSKNGIISSTGQTAGNTIVAVIDNALVGATEWPLGSGHTIDSNSVIGKYTYFGDMDLSGDVTPDDYGILDANLGTTPPPGIAWLSGDADLSGDVTPDDYGILDANIGSGVGNPLAPASVTASAVPEPAGIVAVGGLLAMLSRRKRRAVN